jgi:redox-sensitive bicupin YhaK (pirin superfamily)
MSAWEIRRAASRGAFRNDWLEARFSFSFGDYDEPSRRRFGPLIAINEDVVQPGTGFPMHPHRDLEIVVLPLSGEIEHHDDRGGHATLRPGQWQWMRAGTGIRHRQWNPSRSTRDHHLQIWFEPPKRGLGPRVETFGLPPPMPGTWRTIVSRDAIAHAHDIGVYVALSLGTAAAGVPLTCEAHAGARYLHVVDGSIQASQDGAAIAPLEPGDALVFFDGAPRLELETASNGRLLRFDTPTVDRTTGQAVDRS